MIDAVVTAVDAVATERVVLVVHTFAGMLAPAVAAPRPELVTDVVWLGATVPVEGRSFVDLQPVPARWLLRLLFRVRPSGCSTRTPITRARPPARRLPIRRSVR